MTVIQIIKALHAESFDKQYENKYGDNRDTYFPLEKLMNMPVEGVICDFDFERIKITLGTYA